MIAVKKIWSLVKNYWYIPLVAIVSTLGYLLTKKNKLPVNEILKASKKTHEIEKAAIEQAAKQKISAKQKVQELKGLTELPVVIGFGIKDAQSAISVKDAADGVVVGSVFVDLVGEGGDILEKVTKKTRELSEALS